MIKFLCLVNEVDTENIFDMLKIKEVNEKGKAREDVYVEWFS